MRGNDQRQDRAFSYVSLEQVVGHPLRRVRPMVDEALRELSDHFADLYAG